MAQDNPLLGFFEGIGAGMEAGQRRRTLMERARQGEISPQDVPSFGMTALMGAVRAATPASTRQAQDELQLKMADYALRKQIQEDKTATANLVEYNKLAKARLEAEQEKNNALTYSNSIFQLDRYASNNDWSAFDSQMPPDGFDVALIDQWSAEKRRIADDYGRKSFIEVAGMKEDLSTEGYTPETLSRMTQGSIRAAHEASVGRFKTLDDKLQYISSDQRPTLRNQILTGTPEEKQQAWATLDNASFEAESSIAKVQQDAKKLRALGGAENLAWAKQLDTYAEGLLRGEEVPAYTITTDENGKTTFQIGPASKLEDKAIDRQILVEFPDLLGQLTQLDSIIDPATANVKGPLKRFWNTYGTTAAELLGVPEGTGLNQVFQNVDQIPRLTTAIAQNVRKLVRTDVGMISNYEQKTLEPLTKTLEGVRSATQMRVAISDLKKFLTNSRMLRAHAAGKVPNILRNYPKSIEGFEQAMTDLRAVRNLNEIPEEEVRSYMNYLGGIYDDNIINSAFDGALKPNPAQ